MMGDRSRDALVDLLAARGTDVRHILSDAMTIDLLRHEISRQAFVERGHIGVLAGPLKAADCPSGRYLLRPMGKGDGVG